MKQLIKILAFSSFLVLASCGIQSSKVEAQTSSGSDDKNLEKLSDAGRKPVLVELFTSEGCSSCPPAERLLEKLEKEQPYSNAEIITLALHVDYWDNLGWKDEFSSALFSRRQDIYAQAFRKGQTYTPQMIVDGRTQFVGSNSSDAAKAITENAKNQKANIEISAIGELLKVRISAIPKHDNATVFLAVAEDNLASDVKRGENSGKKLEHISVVRELKSLGMVKPDQNEFKYEQLVQMQGKWKKENLKLVIFVQENQSRKVLGVKRISLT